MSTDEELLLQLSDSLLWTDIRVKLGTLLTEQANKGDERAVGQLTFLAKHWPTGQPPRQSLVNKLMRDCEELNRMLLHATETLISLNLHCPDFVDRLIRSGLDVPSHWRAA